MATLYIVATPIGNLTDFSPRALGVLKEGVDHVLAEDTRVTQKLFEKYGIKTPMTRLDANVEGEMAEKIDGIFNKWQSVALVSDAGTPGISDPGYRFVSAAQERGVEVIPIPGPSAVATALSASGLPADQFVFLGFLPHKKGREKLFDEIAESKRTTVFYESPHRILKSLTSLSKRLGVERAVVVARELTKIHEEIRRDSAENLLNYYNENPDKVRGEFVVIVSSSNSRI